LRADFVREIKKASSVWAAQHRPDFEWQIGYGAFSVGRGDLPGIVQYIANQEEHHRKISSADELRTILKEHGVEYYPKFFD
jgi:hypothetical protein